MRKQAIRNAIPVIRNFEHLRSALNGYVYARVILSALDLSLFTVMGSKSWTVPSLARAIDASERGTDILCRNLASIGLLTVKNGRYWNSPLAATALNKKHPDFRGEYLSLLRRHWDEFSRLTDAIRSGRPLEDDGQVDEDESRRAFTWAMHHRTRDLAPKLAERVNLRGTQTLLDLGGGPGTYSLAFLKKWPTLTATVSDRPAALAVARKIAGKHPAGKRLSYLPLDFMTESIPGSYDVIFMSNVIHIYGPDENVALFKNVKQALNSGGRVMIQDFFLWDSKGLRPTETNLFAVTMLLYTETGNTYRFQDVRRWLKQAGFRSVATLQTRDEPLVEAR